MASIKAALATKATITWTGTSLADAAARESTAIDNATNLYLDAVVRIQTKGSAGSTLTLAVYAYGSVDTGTYTDSATGTDAAFTAANILNSKRVGTVQMNGTTAVVAGPMSVAAAFGGVLPTKWGLIIRNDSGGALSSTAGDHVIEYQGVYATSA